MFDDIKKLRHTIKELKQKELENDKNYTKLKEESDKKYNDLKREFDSLGKIYVEVVSDYFELLSHDEFLYDKLEECRKNKKT